MYILRAGSQDLWKSSIKGPIIAAIAGLVTSFSTKVFASAFCSTVALELSIAV
jgi:hypothetical protein